MRQASQPAQIIFLPSGRRGHFDRGTTILKAAHSLGEPIQNLCGGKLACGKCQVHVEQGHFAKLGVTSSPAHLSALTDVERAWLPPEKAGTLRLACNAHLLDDVVIFVPESSRIHQQTIRKDATLRPITVQPAIRQVYVELEPPSLQDRRSHWERLRAALQASWELDDLSIAYPALRTLPQILREGQGQVTVIVRQEEEVIQVRPRFSEGIWGLAVDIGSTTMVAHLNDLQTGDLLATQAMMNPQVAYGEDLMSRISYANEHEDGLKKLHRAVLGAFNRLAQEVAQQAGLQSSDIHEAVVVGNTTMITLFLNIHPRDLGEMPFSMANREAMDVPASALKLRLHPAARIHILPAIAGHVGADNVAVLLAEEPHRQPESMLLVDVGTNAEIALWNGHQLFSTSSPTGPAFEGAQISQGMRAAPGAIERVRIHRKTGAIRYKIIGEPRWSDAWTDASPPALAPSGLCGSGIIEAVAELFLAGIILPDGHFAPKSNHPRLQGHGNDARFILVTAAENPSGQTIAITQKDVRAIQLAKAALYAGSKILMHAGGIQHVSRVVLAGAFGSYISPFHALALGLIPDVSPEQVLAVGNAAGDGARIALLNQERRAQAQTLARSSHYIETAMNPTFQDEFVAAIHLPHQTDPFTHIARWLPAPPKKPRRRTRKRLEAKAPSPQKHRIPKET
jgi:uncharacterized 2Fe-2S/4Fe-4S cluster protein (DUF4445 family)